MANQLGDRICAVADHVATPELRKKMQIIKQACENGNVSLPPEVEAFFLEYPPFEERNCAQYGYVFQDIVIDEQKTHTEIYISRAEIEAIQKKDYDHIVVYVKNLPQ